MNRVNQINKRLSYNKTTRVRMENNEELNNNTVILINKHKNKTKKPR